MVENLNQLSSERALFHLFNFVRDLGGSLLLTAETIPTFHLPDLQTRIQAVPKAAISMPDEAFVKNVLKQAFSDRQILVEDSVLNYAVSRMPRSFKTIQDIIQTADQLSLAEGRKITIPIVKETLNRVGV